MHEGCLSGDHETVDGSIICVSEVNSLIPVLLFSFLGCFSATDPN